MTFSAPGDYEAISYNVTFPAGLNENTVTINLPDDNVLEPTETFLVQLHLPPEQVGTVLGMDTALISILDNDSEIIHQFTNCMGVIIIITELT